MRIPRSFRRIIPVLAVASIGGCSLFDRDGFDVVVVTEDAGVTQPARFTVRNAGSEVVFLSRCGDHMRPAVDRLRRAGWENTMASACQDNLQQAPWALGPSEARVDSVALSDTGTYRLRVVLARGSASARYADLPSPPFVIR